MNRREFLGAGVMAAGLSSGMPVGHDEAAEAASVDLPQSTGPESISIRAYLCREARRITRAAGVDMRNTPAYTKQFPERRKRYMEMMGLADLPPVEQRSPLNVTVTGVVDRPGYRIEKLNYQALPGLYVTANLYVPAPQPPNNGGQTARRPAVLYVCGHAPQQKVHYQAHPRRFAELGFVTLIVETVELGEAHGNHHGTYSEGWWHWISRGYSPAAAELLTGIRGLDLLAARPDVDPERMGVTGISGGGAVTWWVAAGDERVKCAAPVCGTATLESHIADRTIDGHCDCMWWNNWEGWDLADIGALIAPRPLLICSADRDGIFTISSIREVYGQLKYIYPVLGGAGKVGLVETPGPHSYHERSRTAIFSWFAKYLQGRDIPAGKIGDVDESPAKQESADTLRVFVNGLPEKNRAVTIQDELIKLAEPPKIVDRAALDKERARVVAELKRTTFRQFAPPSPPGLDVRNEYYFAQNESQGARFSFVPEDGWRLRGMYTPAGPGRHPAVVALRSPGEERNAAEQLAGRVRAPWTGVIVEPRGTGDTTWGDELNWHLRRAAQWTGRTLASMRVQDTLAALQAVRQLPDIDGGRLALAARGEMCAVALYAALLDGRVTHLFLENPSATQNAPCQKDGRGPAIEMMGCLRITDLPQVAGLLWPAELVIAGAPEAYAWAEELYRALGAPGRFNRLADLSAWKPA